MEIPAELIIRNLRFNRKKAGLSQAELGKRAGVHPISIWSYENNKASPKPSTAKKLADALATVFREGPPIIDETRDRPDGGRPFGSIRTICPHCRAVNYHYIETPIPGLEIKCITCGCEFRPFDKGPGPTKSHPDPGSNNKKKGNWHKWDRAKETR